MTLWPTPTVTQELLSSAVSMSTRMTASVPWPYPGPDAPPTQTPEPERDASEARRFRIDPATVDLFPYDLAASIVACALTIMVNIAFNRPAAVRIQGLAIGIDVGDEDYADTIHEKCRRNGLLVSTEGSTVLLLPSLAIDKRTAARGLDILARSI